MFSDNSFLRMPLFAEVAMWRNNELEHLVNSAQGAGFYYRICIITEMLLGVERECSFYLCVSVLNILYLSSNLN